MISFTDYIKKAHVSWIDCSMIFLGIIMGIYSVIVSCPSGMILVLIYVIAACVYMCIARRKKYRELVNNGCIVNGIVVSSKKNLLSYRGIINNIIKIKVDNKGQQYFLKSEYKMQSSVYKRHSNIIGQHVRVIINPDNIKNYYIFHEELFDNDGIKL